MLETKKLLPLLLLLFKCRKMSRLPNAAKKIKNQCIVSL